MVAPTLSPEASTWQMVLGGLGFFTACAVIFSALPTFHAIRKTQQVGATKPYAYQAVVLNSAIWVIFGIPVVVKLTHGHHTIADWMSLPLMLANIVGVIVELGYVFVFLLFAGAGNRGWPIAGLAGAVSLPAGVLVLYLRTGWSRTFVGYIAAITGVAMYAIPVVGTHTAYKNNDLTQISTFQACASLANGVVWTAYSCIGRVHFFIFVPNVIAIICAGGQLIVWCVLRWCRAPRRDPEDPRGPRAAEPKVPGDASDASRSGDSSPRVPGAGDGGTGAGDDGHVEKSELRQEAPPKDVPAKTEQSTQGVEGAGVHENNPDAEEVQVAVKNEAPVPEAVAPGGGGGNGDEVENRSQDQEGGGGHSNKNDDDSHEGDGGGTVVKDPGEDKADGDKAIPA